MNKDLWSYVDNREAELLGGLVANDDSAVFIANLISDLAHSEAELLLLSSSNQNAERYAKKSIINGNSAYSECLDKKKVSD